MNFLFLWYNVIFTIPLLVFFVLVILQVIGFGLDNFFDLDIELPGDGTALSEMAFFSNVLFFFNADKVPVGILVLTFMGVFGMIGLVFNGLAHPWLKGFTPGFLIISVPVAFVGGILATKAGSSLLAKYLPELETYGDRKAELEGKVGTVISAKIDEKGGRAHVRDHYGNLISVFCEMMNGEHPTKKGGKILLVQYDKERDTYLCSPAEGLEIG
jgi:membrane protein implicated in regulation of membrane protease activity